MEGDRYAVGAYLHSVTENQITAVGGHCLGFRFDASCQIFCCVIFLLPFSGVLFLDFGVTSGFGSEFIERAHT